VDFDDVELGNLHRQIIHDETKLKKPKVESAAESVRRMNRGCLCIPHNILLDSSNALPLITQFGFYTAPFFEFLFLIARKDLTGIHILPLDCLIHICAGLILWSTRRTTWPRVTC